MSDLKTILMGIASTINSSTIDIDGKDIGDKIMGRKYKKKDLTQN